MNNSNLNPEMTFKHLCYMRMQQLTNFPYIEKDFDALTDYELLCLIVKYLNNVIKNSNEQNESIMNLYNAFITLQDNFNDLHDYVMDYFANLDVQEEINNKLDQMLEDGVLEQIIEQYLNSSAIWGFDTVADMKNATNLINGSYAKTLGYHSKNDNGSGLYKIRTITNDDVVDEASIIEITGDQQNNLIAELIVNNSTVTAEQFGAYGDNEHDDSNAINHALSLYDIVKLDAKTYKISSTITVNSGKTIEGVDRNKSTIKSYVNDEFSIKIGQSYSYGTNGNLNNFKLLANDQTVTKGVYTYATITAHNFSIEGFTRQFEKNNQYADYGYFEKCNFRYAINDGDDINIYIPGPGDGWLFTDCSFDTGDYPPHTTFKMQCVGIQGLTFNSCVMNIDCLFRFSTVNLISCHSEGGRIFDFESSHSTINGCFIQDDTFTNRLKINCTNAQNYPLVNNSLSINNTIFYYTCSGSQTFTPISSFNIHKNTIFNSNGNKAYLKNSNWSNDVSIFPIDEKPNFFIKYNNQDKSYSTYREIPGDGLFYKTEVSGEDFDNPTDITVYIKPDNNINTPIYRKQSFTGVTKASYITINSGAPRMGYAIVTLTDTVTNEEKYCIAPYSGNAIFITKSSVNCCKTYTTGTISLTTDICYNYVFNGYNSEYTCYGSPNNSGTFVNGDKWIQKSTGNFWIYKGGNWVSYNS